MKIASIILFIGGLILTITGFYVMYHYGEYDSELLRGDNSGHVVGGDAYNYIIIGIRGLAFIIAGLSFTVIASTCTIISRMTRQGLEKVNVIQFQDGA